MENSFTFPLQYSNTASTTYIRIHSTLRFVEMFTLINNSIPELATQPYLVSYLDQTSKQHFLFTEVQFQAFKDSLPMVAKVLVVPGTVSPSTDWGDEVAIDDTVMGLHNNWFDAIVIGSGLAGLCSTLTIAEANPKFKIAILEKENSFGGNSIKATSGISLINTPTQASAGVKDSVELFMNDTLNSGKGKSDPTLVSALAEGSRDAWEFLTTKCGVDLSKVTQCGGHSVPRTHRPKGPHQIGYALISTLLGKLEKYKPNVSFYKNCEAKGIMEINRCVKGIFVEYKDEILIRCRSPIVVLSTGGFANDHTEDSLLKEYAPQLAKYPTTNGPFAQGNGIKIARKIGAAVVDMDQIQLHPTGFIDPANRTNRTKILAPELLRGVGAVLLNSEGKRFCNELGLRDYVTEEITKYCKDMTTLMLFGERSGELFGTTLAFYLKKGYIRKFDSLKDFCTHYNLPTETVQSTLQDYNEYARNNKPDQFGKTVFPTLIELDEKAHYYGCEVTPTLHYTMGGLKIDRDGNVQSIAEAGIKPQTIVGLYAVGEAAGGLHGGNRLIGNSLMECVVFGRRAGAAAVKYLTMVSKL